MLISRNWLQSYFTTELPKAEELAHTLLLHAFEIEGVQQIGDDYVIDIDVLPNRAHDCLCHEGVARELAGLLDLEQKKDRYTRKTDTEQQIVELNIENQEKCRRYAAFQIDDVEIKESPQWLKDHLASLGQKTINNIIDATNYVMFDVGQPMHAFDADKVVGAITIRDAKDGEKMTTLSGEELELSVDDLVIADDEGILALAGVKGGTKAEVTEITKNIIIEVANFHPTTTRITSRRVKIQTDSSKRFENEITPDLVSYAAGAIQSLIIELSKGSNKVSGLTDVYPNPLQDVEVLVSLLQIQKVLGLNIEAREVLELFGRFEIATDQEEETFIVTIPARRLDLRISEDLIEEVGRWYGYHNIPSVSISELNAHPEVHSVTLVINQIKNLLIEEGYSELLTYGFVNEGDLSLFNPIAGDKSALRTTLHKQLVLALEQNLKNASYFGADRILLFEIGRVYSKGGEETRCAVACANVNKKAKKAYGHENEQLVEIQQKLEQEFGISLDIQKKENIISFSLDQSIIQLNDSLKKESYGEVFDPKSYGPEDSFQTISVYPHSNRDISLWVNEGVSPAEVEDLIKEQGGQYLKKIYLFDEFSKDGRTSYAFSLIFQADDKTLADTDIDTAMDSITGNMKERNWEVR